jgi:prepilin-type N-terminal cleavage/methylation domain-containing protein
MKLRRGFTLIELLVVVAIIGLLVSILLPSLSKVRGNARRVTCATQLHQVAVGMMSYLQEGRDRMPYVSFMPSVGAAPLTTDRPIWLADVLKRHLSGGDTVLQCPNDTPDFGVRDVPNTGRSYFQSERSSYGYRTRLAGYTPNEFTKATEHRHRHQGEETRDTTKKLPANTIWFANDYNNFHGKAGQVGSRRYAYIDGHVSDFEN